VKLEWGKEQRKGGAGVRLGTHVGIYESTTCHGTT
jgi:hypothetical protein